MIKTLFVNLLLIIILTSPLRIKHLLSNKPNELVHNNLNYIADSLFYTFEYSNSLSICKELLKRYTHVNDSEQIIKTNLKIMDCYLALGEIDSAKIYFDINTGIISNSKFQLKSLIARNNFFIIKLAYRNENYSKVYSDCKQLNQKCLFIKNQELNFEEIKKYLYLSSIFLKKEQSTNKFFLQLQDYYDSITNYQKKFNFFVDLGITYLQVGKYEKSINYFQKAKKLINKHIPNHPLISKLIYNISICYFRMGKKEKAIQSISNDVDFKLYKKDLAGLYNFLNLFGYYYFLKGNYRKATYYFRYAIKSNLSSLKSSAIDLFYSYSYLGTLSYLSSNYKLALSYYTNSLSILNNMNLDDINMYNKSYCYILLGNVYNKMDNYPKSIFNYKKALKWIKRVNISYMDYEIICNINLGLTYLKHGKSAESLKYFDKVSNSIVNMSAIKNSMPFMIPQILYYYGQLELGLGNKEQALSLIFQAVDITKNQSLGSSFEKSRFHITIAKIYENDGMLDSALVYYQKAIIYSIENYYDQNPKSNPKVEHLPFDINLIESLHCKANTLAKYYQKSNNITDLMASLDTYLIAIEFLDRLKCRFHSEKLKLSFGAKNQKIFKDALNIAFNLYSITKAENYLELAFRIVQINKAAALRQAINESNAKIHASIPDSLIEKEKQIKKEWNKYNNLLYQLENSPQLYDSIEVMYLQRNLFELNKDYDFLIDYFETQYPQYYELKYNPNPITLKEIQLKQNTSSAFLEYYILDSSLIIFSVNTDTILVKKITINGDFKNNVSLLLKTIAERDFENYIEIAHQLYQLLIKPVEQIVSKTQLVIIPDNVLGYVPFEALLTKSCKAKSRDFRTLPYLIKKTSVIYDYSASLLYSDIQINTNYMSEKLYGFAPIIYQ